MFSMANQFTNTYFQASYTKHCFLFQHRQTRNYNLRSNLLRRQQLPNPHRPKDRFSFPPLPLPLQLPLLFRSALLPLPMPLLTMRQTTFLMETTSTTLRRFLQEMRPCRIMVPMCLRLLLRMRVAPPVLVTHARCFSWRRCSDTMAGTTI